MSNSDRGSGRGAFYRINAPDVAAQVIDGEAILIAFQTGCYYSARGVGGAIVEAVQKAASVSRILDALSGSSASPFSELEIRRFLGQLEQEGLIREGALADASSEPWEANVRGAGGLELEKFTDLEDLLLLDPIHDVDAAGWPMAKAEAPTGS